MILSKRTDPMCPNSNFTHNKYNYGETRDLRPKYLSGQIILPVHWTSPLKRKMVIFGKKCEFSR